MQARMLCRFPYEASLPSLLAPLLADVNVDGGNEDGVWARRAKIYMANSVGRRARTSSLDQPSSEPSLVRYVPTPVIALEST